jgi:hypothetical protein
MSDAVHLPAVPRPADLDRGPIPGDSTVASLVPFGLGDDRGAHPYRTAAAALVDNRDSLAYATNILSTAVCDGCALGPRGLADDAAPGLHLCDRRLEQLRDATIGPLAPVDLVDVGRIVGRTAAELRRMGRLPYPFVRRSGEAGFSRVSWDEAYAAIRAAGIQKPAFVAGPAGPTNEAYFAFAAAALAVGAPPPAFATNLPHREAPDALRDAIGVAGTPGTLADVTRAELVLVWRCQPVATAPMMAKYLHLAKQQGARVVAIDDVVPPGLSAAWIPTIPRSALFGTRLADDVVRVRPGGEVALVAAILAILVAWDAVDDAFVAAHTAGWEGLRAALARPLDDLLDRAGVRINDVEWLARLIARAKRIVSVVGTGTPRAPFGRPEVRAVVDLHLARGAIGRPGATILPLVPDAGLIGGWDVGIRGANEDVAGAHAVIGLHAELPGAPMRVHQATHVDPSMLAPGELVVLLPAENRHEQAGGGTATSVDRRVRFTPAVAGHPRIGEVRPQWRIPLEVATALGGTVPSLDDPAAIRVAIAKEHPMYAGIEELRQAGQSVQWGGASPVVGGEFPKMPDRRAWFSPLLMAENRPPPGWFRLVAGPGDDVVLDAADAARLGIVAGAKIRVLGAADVVGTARIDDAHAGEVVVGHSLRAALVGPFVRVEPA